MKILLYNLLFIIAFGAIALPFAEAKLDSNKVIFAQKPAEATAIITFFVDNKLYAAEKVHLDLEVILPSNIIQSAQGRQGEIVIYPINSKLSRELVLGMNLSGEAKKLPKPMNYGIFVDNNDFAHFWYIGHDYKYYFDGDNFQPFGGMWCPLTLEDSTSDPVKIESNMAYDLKILDEIQKYGIVDVYFNRAINAPNFVKQRFIDEMEKRGIFYGYQLTIGENEVIPSFFITREAIGRSNWQNPMIGHIKQGNICVDMPLEYKINSLLLLPISDKKLKNGKLVMFSDSTGKDSRHGIIDLDKTKDHSKVRQVQIRDPFDLPENSQLLVIPLLDAKMSHPNLLDPEYLKMAKEKTAWIKDIKWGKNFRFIVDPLYNETHLVNGTENLRQYTPAINSAYEKFLQAKYEDIAKLSQAWQLPVDNFAVAARLIPQSLSEQFYLIDPQTGNVNACDAKESMSWLDYNDFIRVSYALESDYFAQYLKSLVNIPIIYKSVEGQGSKTYQSTVYNGFDGIGFEVYLNQGLPQEGGGGAARCEAEFASHTMWKIATEAGYNAALGNGGKKFFPNEKTMNFLADELASMGVNGFYFFGFALGEIWSNHNFHDFPNGLKWLSNLKNNYKKSWILPNLGSYVYPSGYTWWWWTTRNLAVYGYEASQIPQSTRLPDGTWAYSTEIVPDEFELVIINCEKPPFSKWHASEIQRLINTKKNIVYLGSRDDLGVIPELDKYFTKRVINFADGSSAQELNALSGRVLAKEKNAPWAIRDKNLTIISRTPVRDVSGGNRDSGFRYFDKSFLPAKQQELK